MLPIKFMFNQSSYITPVQSVNQRLIMNEQAYTEEISLYIPIPLPLII